MFSDNLKKARIEAGISQRELASHLFVSQQAVAKWEVGSSTPGPETVSRIAEILGVSYAQLLDGEPSDRVDVYRVPVLGRVAAGIPLYATEEIIDWEELPKSWERQGEFFCLQIHGNSMEPRMCEGDVVVIRKQETCENGQTAIVLVNGDEAACKRVVFQDNGIILISNNPMFPPQFFTADKVRTLPVQIIGVVVELRAKFD